MQNLSRFFVDRPIFAGVLSVLMLLAGLIAMWRLPISEYPEVVPPSIVVEAKFPGANPAEISETVASPLEEQINGVEGMLYINSLATTDGNLSLTVTFEIGTDPDLAQQKVQNRVSQAEPRLPDIVRQLGVTVAKRSPDLTMVVHLRSPNERYDMLYLRNYATLNVRDRLARINGVGQVGLFGSGDYAMRVWLNPDKVAERNLTAGEVVSAIQSQNVQVAAGIIGGAPYDSGVQFQLPINISGRLESPEEFQNIIIKRETDGTITRLGDVARVEMEAQQYALRSLLDNKPAVAIPIFASPGSNALDISSNVRATMEELKQSFPDDLDYSIVYDPTVFVRGSIKSVIKTLLEAIALVVIVVTVFLQTWRASIIPLLAVPVSIIGTFALMLLMGFSINVLSLFGLILAIGIVVDDAIVVVENVERNIERGLSPRDATVAAMREVTGPIIATSLVITGVFVPIAFISGLTGQFYQQFALTIAIATIISTINSLTLSPALSAVLLRGHDAPKDWLTRGMDFVFGWFFRGFNRFFNRSTDLYAGGVKRLLGVKAIMMALYVGLLALTYQGFQILPTGFVPLQDKQYLVSFAQLPQGATLDRTEDVIREMSDIALNEPGVESAVAFPGLSINGFVNSSSAGIVFVTLTDFAERTSDDLSGLAIAGKLQQKFGAIDEAFVAIFPAPPVQGLGTVGGFKLQVQDRSDQGYGALDDAMKQVLAKAWAAPELTGVFSSYNINVPQLQATLDRTKVQQLGIPVDEIFQTMQVYLGSMYVNDFNAFGRTYQVIAQADKPYRSSPEDILRLQTRNADGDMVPLGSVLSVSETFGPDTAMRYNAFRSADLNGNAAPGYSSGEAQAAITKILEETLPPGMSYEWTELTYQQILAGNTAIFVFPICILLVFLVLAAQYESLTMPLAVILIVPMSILSAVFGVYLFGGDNNIFTQISLFVLAGLASKNAILIVEFARELEHQGRSTLQAAIEASRLRLRPILMTSLAFIMGVVPLVLSSGAGAEMRHAIGIAVFSGMLGVTVFGLILTPVFYVLVRMIGRRNDVRELDGAGVDQPAE
ncbi:multidrug efflux RND transporter permease subunit [Thalassospira sp.]|uniref:efflux RND transporter permease subunit n=1 Tax=Thalassospira sp. TaxID=1912094 RepID=UPI000C38C17C|nr:multidrug efflux RND transporter permease subunit [Thalassospira sp.]MBC06852.1 multidrug efflux RND transporter permease subunit [Thalassospira sp.]|tara:strand:+ start:5432 stop:8611 length:3180 start_codon:yes stop_codon:yes gene_type:complete